MEVLFTGGRFYMGWLILSIFFALPTIGGLILLISGEMEALYNLPFTLIFGFLSYYFMKKYKRKKQRNAKEEDAKIQEKESKGKRYLHIVAVLFVITLIVGIVGNIVEDNNDSDRQTVKEKDAIKTENIIIDVSQFSRISSERLIEIMGGPESKEEWNFESANGNVYPVITYTYKNGDYEFLIIDDKVVEFNIYSSENNVMKYEDEASIFSMFGITPAETILKVADTGAALRYESVTDKIDEFWIPILDSEKKTIDIVKVRYDKTYFGDPPRMAMTISEQTDLQIRCQNAIKSILKAPSTAKFPSITEWYFAKDREKIVVQSYVDAQNSFGAEIRSEFQVTFTPSGDTITSLIFDGEEYIKK